MFNRVLVLTVDIGGGHTRAAQAVQAAFGRLGAAGEIHVVDTFNYINTLFRKLLETQAPAEMMACIVASYVDNGSVNQRPQDADAKSPDV